MKNWQKIYYSTSDAFKIALLKSMLESQGINSVIINKRDTAYNNFGEQELYVNKLDLVAALKIIAHEIRFE
jgi:Putative prokaryotic signal transducing protein